MQYFDKSKNRWIKGKMVKGKNGGKRFVITDVKQKQPTIPFKGVPKK